VAARDVRVGEAHHVEDRQTRVEAQRADGTGGDEPGRFASQHHLRPALLEHHHVSSPAPLSGQRQIALGFSTCHYEPAYATGPDARDEQAGDDRDCEG